ncbi:MAG: hypothetical protein ACREQ3_22515, partial [Candidatus Binatia bacterium]
MTEPYDGANLTHALPSRDPLYIVALHGPGGERRLPVDIIKEEILPLPAATWIAFTGGELGDSPAHAADLMRRLALLKHNWIGQANLALLQTPALLQLAQQSRCRALVFDGEQISGQYLATEASFPLDALSQLTTSLRQLPAYGVLSIARFVFGYDNDDEGVFERTACFCMDARLGLPYFSVLTPAPESPLCAALEGEGRLLHKDWQRYDGSHVVFQPRLMTPEALENGLHWIRQQVYSQSAIWQRVFSWRSNQTLRHLLANYTQRRPLKHGPRG